MFYIVMPERITNLEAAKFFIYCLRGQCLEENLSEKLMDFVPGTNSYAGSLKESVISVEQLKAIYVCFKPYEFLSALNHGGRRWYGCLEKGEFWARREAVCMVVKA